VVICLERRADLRIAQLMPLPLTVSCFSKIQIGFTFLVPAHPGSPGKRAIKRVCVCVCTVDNGFNPVWSESCEFDVINPSVALLRFVVQDVDMFGDPNFLGQATFPLACVRPGCQANH